MLAGNPVSGMVSPAWFGSYADAALPPHAAAPSIAASSTSTSHVSSAVTSENGQVDWIVQFNAAANRLAGAAGAAGPAAARWSAVPGRRRSWGRRRSVDPLLRRQAEAAAALRSDRQVAWFETDSLQQTGEATPNDPQFSSNGP